MDRKWRDMQPYLITYSETERYEISTLSPRVWRRRADPHRPAAAHDTVDLCAGRPSVRVAHGYTLACVCRAVLGAGTRLSDHECRPAFHGAAGPRAPGQRPAGDNTLGTGHSLGGHRWWSACTGFRRGVSHNHRDDGPSAGWEGLRLHGRPERAGWAWDGACRNGRCAAPACGCAAPHLFVDKQCIFLFCGGHSPIPCRARNPRSAGPGAPGTDRKAGNGDGAAGERGEISGDRIAGWRGYLPVRRGDSAGRRSQ